MSSHRPRWPVVLAVILAVLVAAGIGGYWYLRPLLRTGTGYAAHNLCAVVDVAGRADPESDLPPNPLVPYLTPFHDGDGRSRVAVAGFLAGQDAWFTPGFGCTVASRRPVLPAATAVDAAPEFASEPDPAVGEAIAKAFGDDLDAGARTALGTRAVVVLRDGVVVGERYADGFTASTRQLGWSMTKSVTNLLTGRLVLEGKVALDDRLLRTEWNDERSDITVDDLLRMTSGLEWDETYDLGTPITEMLYTQPDMAAFVAGQPAAHPAGTVQQYSSGSTTLLCSVLNTKAGKGANLPREELFAPLGLGSAVLEVDATGTPVCGSYLWATPRDWARIGEFARADGVVNRERLLPEGWMDASTTVKPVSQSDAEGMAASWWANDLGEGRLLYPALPPDTYWATGHDGQRMFIVPGERLVVVRMGFSPEADDIRVPELVADVIAAGP